jgi:hypothetical protein
MRSGRNSRAVDDGVQIGSVDVQFLVSRKVQHAADDRIGAPHCRRHVIEQLPHRRFAVLESLRQELDAGQDRHQRVLDLMRDAGGHSADRLQLLRLDHLELHRPQLLERIAQPGLGLRALGDVLAGRHDADHRTAGVLHDVGTKVYRKHGPVAPDVGRLAAAARDLYELVLFS